jgi:PAS domain S-box-containing protein
MPFARKPAFFDSMSWQVICLFATALVFWTDSLTPLGFDHGSLYILLTLVVALTCTSRCLALVTALGAALIIAGIFISPPGIDMRLVLVNRAVSILELLLVYGAATLIRRENRRNIDTWKALQHSQSVIDQQRELLEIATESAQVGGWTMTVPGLKITWSDTICRLLDVPPGHQHTLAEVLGYCLPGSLELMEAAIQLCIESGQPFQFEAELESAKGRRIWVLVTGEAARDSEDRIIQIQGALQDLTSEKQNQATLVQLSHRFQQLADAVPQILWTATPEGSTDFCNKALLDLCGMDTPELLHGSGWTTIIATEDIAAAQQAWQQALQDGSDYTHSVRIRCHDGSQRWHVVQAQPVCDDQGLILKWCGSAVDIHETRVLAERQIRILESITDAFMLIDHEWNFSCTNQEAERLLHCRREDLLGRNVWSLFPDAGNFELHYRRVVDEQVPLVFEEYYASLDCWFEVRAFPAEDGLAVYFRDISAHRQRSEEMRLARERFELLARATTDAVWDWDLLNDSVWWNDSMHSLFGYASDEIEQNSSSWTRWIHPDDYAEVVNGIMQAVAGNDNGWHDEYRFRRKDGTYAVVTDTGYIIRNNLGKAVRMVGGMVDISEKRLMQERLDQAQRLEALGQLTGGVAHDFNNLLTVIMGNGELLAEMLQHDPDRQTLVDQINQAAGRAGALTRHLLAFARRQPLAPEAVDIKRLINNMDGMLRRTLMSNIEIEMVHSAGLWPALVDGSQLENALLNLCLNARDAMPNGGRLSIETGNAFLDQSYADRHGEILAGQYVVIGVSDSGTGMAQDTLTHVFDPFFTTKEPGKGTGLGLSMVYGFVKQSKGHIKVYTEIGQGTTVRLYLPRAIDISAQHDASVTAPLRGDNDAILLVEDDELVSSYAQNLLGSMGFRVLSASNGPEALLLLEQHPEVKLLFTDIIMPGGCGTAAEPCTESPVHLGLH